MLESLKLLPKLGAMVQLTKEIGIYEVGTLGVVRRIYPEKQILIQINKDEYTLVQKSDFKKVKN
jgi:hypothetical protein